MSQQVIVPHAALRVLVGALASAQGHNERRGTPLVQNPGVVQAGTEDRRRAPVVLRRAEHHDGVGRSGLVHDRVTLDLYIDPAAPEGDPDNQRE